ncbi:hypothetical protein IPF89_00635 [Candidatus Saccharibacteria bacterium]|nr:MAG: hypothetical protein IPF89_00635 [Candidatus Saccharibacteria bacterium]
MLQWVHGQSSGYQRRNPLDTLAICRYVDKHFDKIEDDIAELKSDVSELKSDVNRIYGILDTHMSRIETLIQETKVQAHQQARLERWIFQLADQAGVHLKYDG